MRVLGAAERAGLQSEYDAEPLAGVDLATIHPRRVDWLWRGYVPLRKLTILDGDPGLGKSTLLIDLACRGSIGGNAPTGEPLGDAFTTIYVSIEDDPEDTIVPRVLRAGGDPARFRLVRDLTLPDDVERLRQYSLANKARLIIVDPLVAYLGDEVRTNDDHRVRRALEPLAAMAQQVDAAVVAIRHLNKRAGDDAIYRGGGSIGFTGLARSVLAVGRDPDDADRIVLAAVKLNVARRPASLAYRIVADGPYEAATIAWEGESDHDAEDLIGRTRDAAGQVSKTAQLAEAIRRLVALNSGSMRASDAYRALEADGIDTSSKDNMTRARSQARVVSIKDGFDGPWLWRFRP
ncbi:MAG: AAA family ATPase [Chloroflexi bacterium]|nr:AAA family ATPase [Chloroflexota bacterium]